MVDIIVIGGGHAGIEAALAASRMGMETVLYTMHIDMIGSMPCNPSVGGPAKGIVVREIDALGGEMGRAADATALQFKMLNTTKGPGVQSLRVQSDKIAYRKYMQDVLLHQEHLQVREQCVERVIASDGKVKGVQLQDGHVEMCRALIITSGTFMSSTILVGHRAVSGGPEGEPTTDALSQSLRDLGIRTFRLKTGTPARVKSDSIDFTKTAVQPGTDDFVCFSEDTTAILPFAEQAVCYLTYTTPQTHQIIRDHLEDSAMYSGLVKGVGPRYCPSIEDKLVRFADKPRHQIFLEPESRSLDTTYIQGFSTSMPHDVQEAMLHSLPGLEHCVIDKYAYAIEYDCINPNQLYASLEFKKIRGLFSGGQFNGSSGYAEAACQGLIAGINAAMEILGREPLVLDRSEAYIGVLIDDLVTKENHEPYRMMTSRAEYRLLLRQDNADLRLTKKGYEIGLISKERYDWVCKKEQMIKEEIDRVAKVHVGANKEVQALLESYGSIPLNTGVTLTELIRRPELDYDKLAPIDHERPELPEEVREQVNILIKYDGYISRQIKQVESFKKLEKKKIPEGFDYDEVPSLRIEARQKLKLYSPTSIGQASRISGVSPADVSVLLVYMEQMNHHGEHHS